MPQSRAFHFSPALHDPVSFGTVYADCVLGECDAVVIVTYRAYDYQLFLKASHYMARDWEICREVWYGQFTGSG